MNRNSPRTSGRCAALALGFLLAALTPCLAYTTVSVDAGRGPVTVHVPNAYSPATPTPLLVLLHGYSSSGSGVDSYVQFLSLVDSRNFLYVFPNGRTDNSGLRFWTATDACCNLYGIGGPDDDSNYLRNLVDKIQAVLEVDRQRIWFAGHSNGGFMSYRMACDHSEIVAAVVSLAGATFADPADCPARQPVHVLQIHGTNDNTILYGGGSLFGVPYPGAVATTEGWAGQDGCDDSLVVPLGQLDLMSGPALDTDTFRYAAGCNIPGSAEHWRINGGSHTPTLSAGFKGLVLDYLFAHPKQALRFADPTTLSWPSVAAARWYNVYRGDLTLGDGDDDGLPEGGYGACVSQTDPDIFDTAFTDTTVPDPDEGFVYTVGYTDSDFGEQGGIGVTSAGLQRSSPTVCP